MIEKTGVYKVYCELLDALPDTNEVSWKVWAHSEQDARRTVFGWIRNERDLQVVTERVEFMPDEPFRHYNGSIQ